MNCFSFIEKFQVPIGGVRNASFRIPLLWRQKSVERGEYSHCTNKSRGLLDVGKQWGHDGWENDRANFPAYKLLRGKDLDGCGSFDRHGLMITSL